MDIKKNIKCGLIALCTSSVLCIIVLLLALGVSYVFNLSSSVAFIAAFVFMAVGFVVDFIIANKLGPDYTIKSIKSLFTRTKEE
jgi:hypothetical protein